ncbi:hypothetical protein EDC04DRAFT_2914201 [Pisolithus marmoratus]|nr:hypothetical protein EDC04DRAFT_2914201 [Pisolithus marmoratus]
MVPSGDGTGYPQYSVPSQPIPQVAMSSVMTKQTKKHAQDPGKTPGNKMVLWEPYPQLTRDLLTWILDHPADHAILFNEKIDQSMLGKPHSMQKKNINAVIADSLFHHNQHYSDLLKNKYQQQASRFKSTGEGISLNDPNHRNLHEKVLTDFPFWDECNWLWCSNLAYDARVFNVDDHGIAANPKGKHLSLALHVIHLADIRRQDECPSQTLPDDLTICDDLASDISPVAQSSREADMDMLTSALPTLTICDVPVMATTNITNR